jgi:hypothetical protein
LADAAIRTRCPCFEIIAERAILGDATSRLKDGWWVYIRLLGSQNRNPGWKEESPMAANDSGILVDADKIYSDLISFGNQQYFPFAFNIGITPPPTNKPIQAVEVVPLSAKTTPDPNTVAITIRPQILSVAHSNSNDVLPQIKSFMNSVIKMGIPTTPTAAVDDVQTLVDFLVNTQTQEVVTDLKIFDVTTNFDLGAVVPASPPIDHVDVMFELRGAFMAIDKKGYTDNTFTITNTLTTNPGTTDTVTLSLLQDKSLSYPVNSVIVSRSVHPSRDLLPNQHQGDVDLRPDYYDSSGR